MPPADHLSTGQAANLLSVTADTVLKWIKKGKIPATRTAGGPYRVLWSVVQALREGTLEPSVEPENGQPVFCLEFHATDDGIS
ncbi:MAG: helix-turn-helix domain-containing protein, partial [Deltaproteobacteria bacterium]|nr:helix-turn-helix domain-containing protein [Deltaproteobacteria bacterium]